MTPSHALATLAVAGLALAATAAPASAQEVTVKDARGDVWGSVDAITATPSPAIKEGDISKAVVRHEGDRAQVRIGFAKLARKGAYAQYAVKFQGSSGNVVREVLVETSKRDRSGVLRVFNAQGQPVETFRTLNRYRDIAVHPDQRTFYLATDPSGNVRDAAGELTPKLENPGSILELKYTGAN